jgi:hypothetical protein
MAVKALPHVSVQSPPRAVSLGPAILALTLIAPTLDFLVRVLPSLPFAPDAALITTGAASILLLVTWVRSPRASWLAAAGLAACASFGLRVAHADAAPALALLAVIALGLGGAFASPETVGDSDAAPVSAR